MVSQHFSGNVLTKLQINKIRALANALDRHPYCPLFTIAAPTVFSLQGLSPAMSPLQRQSLSGGSTRKRKPLDAACNWWPTGVRYTFQRPLPSSGGITYPMHFFYMVPVKLQLTHSGNLWDNEHFIDGFLCPAVLAPLPSCVCRDPFQTKLFTLDSVSEWPLLGRTWDNSCEYSEGLKRNHCAQCLSNFWSGVKNTYFV